MKFAVYAMPTYDASFGLTQGEFLRKTVDQFVSAEALGYDSVWVNEHHFHSYGGLLPSLPTILGALSQRTTRVRLGTSVVVLPLHNPLEVAEQMAMVDLLSNGRLELGVGRGFVEHDYQVLRRRLHRCAGPAQGRPRGRPPAPGRARASATRAATITSTTCRSGRDPSSSRTRRSGSPSPATPPASITPPREGFSVVTTGHSRPPERTAPLAQHYRDAWQAAGHTAPANLAVHYHCVVAEDRAEAWRLAEAGLHEHNRLNHETRSLSQADPGPEPAHPTGRAAGRRRAHARRHARRRRQHSCAASADETGATEAHCMFQFGSITFDQAQRSLELFAREVMPKFAGHATSRPSRNRTLQVENRQLRGF